MPWFINSTTANTTLASAFARAVNSTLGFPNYSGSKGPIFLYWAQNTTMPLYGYQMGQWWTNISTLSGMNFYNDQAYAYATIYYGPLTAVAASPASAAIEYPGQSSTLMEVNTADSQCGDPPCTYL